jgi:hypothetical protein
LFAFFLLINKSGHLLAHLLNHICTLLCAFLSCIWMLLSCFSCWLCSQLVMSTWHLFLAWYEIFHYHCCIGLMSPCTNQWHVDNLCHQRGRVLVIDHTDSHCYQQS